MKNIALFLIVALLSFVIVSPVSAKGGARGGSVYVRGHVTKSGTYVPPHVRTAPNSTQRDNWSTKGNVNPYTGKQGTREPQR